MNVEQYPKRYRIEFIEPGICNYEDVEQGRVFVSRETLDRMKSTYIGKPVVNNEHKDLTASEAFKLSDEKKFSIADGVVYDCGWLDNGWQFADVMIWNISTQQNIDDGYSASCAYKPTRIMDGGVWHGFEYDEEVTDGIYTHMAIVENPRYEGAKIYELPNEIANSKATELWNQYLNSKQKEKKMIFKFLFPKEKKNEAPAKEEVKEEKFNAEDSYIEIDGVQVPLTELIKTWQGEQAEKQITENVIKPEDELDIDGKKVLAQELIDCYAKNKAKMNSEDEAKKNEVEDDEKKKEQKGLGQDFHYG